MMSLRTTSGRLSPAAAVTSFWCSWSYCTVTGLTSVPGCAFSKAGMTSSSRVVTGPPSL